jgi:CheY-like chemotaxis protein
VVKELGHAPSCATNGAEALDLYDARGADVVVSDWMMPRLDGVQLCRCVRSRLGAPYTYFILLTGLDDPEHRLSGMKAGADDYLSKPFNLADMEARLVAAERVMVIHRRHEALLRLARRFAAETDPTRLLDDLLHEAVELVDGASGSVTRWDDELQALLTIGSTASFVEPPHLRLGEAASGRAAQVRAPVLVRPSADVPSVLAVPLLHDARLLGTLAVGAADAERSFTQEDAELLELLASTAAGALVALEHARLDGVLLAARTAQHELNNQLAVVRGYAELLVGSPDLPAHLHDMAAEVMTATLDAATIVRQMRTISHIHEQHWNDPADNTINLERSQT